MIQFMFLKLLFLIPLFPMSMRGVSVLLLLLGLILMLWFLSLVLVLFLFLFVWIIMSRCVNQFRMRNPNFPETSKIEYINCACGKCYNCLSNRRMQWWFRLFNESISSDDTAFVTLTYDDLHCDGILHPDHFRDYVKRLRSIKNVKFTYYGIGEYGTHTLRPHYHLMLFIDYFGSDSSIFFPQFQNKWPYGFVDVGLCNPASINYILHYHVRPKEPVKGLKTFQRFSKGLGLSFLFHYDDVDGVSTLVVNDSSVLRMLVSSSRRIVSDGVGHSFVIPRYYVKKLKDQGVSIPEPDYVDSVPFQDLVRSILPDVCFRSDGTCINYPDSYILSLLDGIRDSSNRKLSRYNYQTKTSL